MNTDINNIAIGDHRSFLRFQLMDAWMHGCSRLVTSTCIHMYPQILCFPFAHGSICLYCDVVELMHVCAGTYISGILFKVRLTNYNLCSSEILSTAWI